MSASIEDGLDLVGARLSLEQREQGSASMPSMGGHGTGALNSEAGFELVAATLTVSTTAS